MILLTFNPVTLLLVFFLYSKVNEGDLFYYPILLVGSIVDLVVNVTWFTLIFLDIPKEFLLTKRVERLKTVSGYRGKVALYLCGLMNRIKPQHCK